MPDATPRTREAAELPDGALVDAVRGRQPTADPTDALRELVRRGRAGTPLLGEVVTDAGGPPELRAAAAVALGRVRDPASRRALTAALDDRAPGVLRRAAEALGKVGDADALDRLEAVRAPRGAAGRSVAFARTLLSYRLGRDTHRLERPPADRELAVQADQAAALAPEAVAADTLRGVLEDAAAELPGVAVSEAGARQFRCDDHRFALLLARDVAAPDDLGALARTSAVVGVLLERSPSTPRYFLAEYLLAHPAPRGGGVRLFGVRPDGVLAHVGDLDPDSGAFTVRALDTRVSPPVDVAGTYDPAGKTLGFSRMLVQRDFAAAQRPPGVPELLDPPVE